MCDILSAKMGNAPKKAKATGEGEMSTVNMQDYDFDDWVPIDNNKADFDLDELLTKIKKENENIQGNISNKPPAVENPPANMQVVPLQNAQKNIITNPAVQPSTSNQNAVINYSQASNMPVVPKMFFPNSNVTINYNFNVPNNP